MKIGLDIGCIMCTIYLWIAKESDSYSVCSNGMPGVDICSNHEVTMTSDAIINAVNVPKFQQAFCECIIAPSYHGHDAVNFSFILYGTYSKYMQFKINDIVMESPYSQRNTFLTGETTLYFFTDEHYSKEEACLYLNTQPQTKFNISCTKPKTIITTTLVTDTTTSVTSEDVATEAAKSNITMSLTSADTTSDASKDNITKYAQRRSKSGQDSSGKLTAIVAPTVIGALLVLTVSVILLVYFKRSRLAKETIHHEQEHYPTSALSEQATEQGQGQQNIASGEECGLNISVNIYERLNMYVNDNLAGEMYQQLKADKNEDYQEMQGAKNDSGNQDRHFTKETVFQEGKGQDNNSKETSPNVYETLNMCVNDTPAGEMYQQLQADTVHGKNVPGSDHRTVKSDRKTDTNTNENTFAVYTNAILQGDEYDDIA